MGRVHSVVVSRWGRVLWRLYSARSILAHPFIAQITLSIDPRIVLILALVLAIVVPRVAFVDYHLVVSVQIGGEESSLGQYLG